MLYVFINFLVLLHDTLSLKIIIHILSTLHSLNIVSTSITPLQIISCPAHDVEELKLVTIPVEIKHPPMSTPFPIFTGNKYTRPTSTFAKIMVPLAPPPAKPSSFQHVEFQTSDYNIKAVPKKERGIILKLPYTAPTGTKINMISLAQISQDLKISAKQEINNKISIPDGLNLKER